jgi:hypothetical protein
MTSRQMTLSSFVVSLLRSDVDLGWVRGFNERLGTGEQAQTSLRHEHTYHTGVCDMNDDEDPPLSVKYHSLYACALTSLLSLFILRRRRSSLNKGGSTCEKRGKKKALQLTISPIVFPASAYE